MVRGILITDASRIAALHMAELHTYFHYLPGRKLLTCYYRVVSGCHGANGFVWVNDEESVYGFVCGIWDESKLQRALLLRECLSILFWQATRLLLQPQLFGRAIRRLKRTLPLIRGKSDLHGAARTFELRPIVVREDLRGRGIADALLQRLLDDARARGFESVFLLSEVGNRRANAFYSKSGFLLENTAAGYHRYSLRLQPDNQPGTGMLR